VHPAPGQASPQLQIIVWLVAVWHPQCFVVVSIVLILIVIVLIEQSYHDKEGRVLQFGGRDLYNSSPAELRRLFLQPFYACCIKMSLANPFFLYEIVRGIEECFNKR
jgi:hypothetical protein